MNLLEKAKQKKSMRHPLQYTREDKELVMAWVNDEIGICQVAHAWGISSISAYVRLANKCKRIIKTF